MDIDDRVLVQKCLSGDKTAFEQLVKRHSPRIFHIIHRFFNDKLLIEDIAQEVFIKAYTSLESYGQKSPFENWLSKIAIHVCYRQLQIQRKHEKNLYSDFLNEEYLSLDNFCLTTSSLNRNDSEKKTMLREIVEKILLRLSAKEKMILILTEVEGMTVQEVSQLMGLSPINIKVGKLRARRHAMKILKDLSRKNIS
jgi:RNA polymerase sigma-70 factor (ECF subfamily)